VEASSETCTYQADSHFPLSHNTSLLALVFLSVPKIATKRQVCHQWLKVFSSNFAGVKGSSFALPIAGRNLRNDTKTAGAIPIHQLLEGLII
jgi:hypothetical protein